MAAFRITPAPLPGLLIIEPTVFGDQRGYFMETYNRRTLAEAGFDHEFVQDNESRSQKGVLRGLHFQTRNTQGKLVRVIEGEVYDAVLDLRTGSPAYGRSFGLVLSGTNRKMLYVPEGFAHGFLVLSDTALFSYKCTDYYNPEAEGGIIWNDPDAAVPWPLDGLTPQLSAKDERLPRLADFVTPFRYEPEGT